jgi:phosphoribosylglycinamide formyltransferase-1
VVAGDVTPTARIGLFSTLTSTGSRSLVTTMLEACRRGDVGGVEVAFVFNNREEGESPVTDESVALLESLGVQVVRASAARFRAEERKSARQRQAAGDPEAMWAWRDSYYASFRGRLPPTDLDLLLGDMWIWARQLCRERRGVNLHPALPSGPLGKMWFDVIWDLVASEAELSGVMLHRVTPAVDRGPVVSYCVYCLRDEETAPLWRSMPGCLAERAALIASQRALKREATHPLFRSLRARGLAREMPLMLETVRAVADGRLQLADRGVTDGQGRPLPDGLDLTELVERAVEGGR